MSLYALAPERAVAPVGCEYIAPLFAYRWFRWNGEGSRPSGVWKLGAELKNQHMEGSQVYDAGEWHPVTAYASDWCVPWESSGLPEVWKGEVGA